MSSHPTGRVPGHPPAPLSVASGLVLVEGLITVLFGLSEAAHTTSHRVVMGATTALFFVLYGAGLLACAWGLRTMRTWARGPVLLSQLMWLGLAWNFRHGALLPLAIFGAISAVIVLAGMLHPDSVDALDGNERS